MSSDKTSAPFLASDARVRTTWQTIGLIIAVTAAGVAAWATTRSQVEQNSKDIANHERRFEVIDAKFDALQREIVSEQRTILNELRTRADRDRRNP